MNRVYLSLGLAVLVVEAQFGFVAFNCETGTKQNNSAMMVTTPTQASCCEVQGEDDGVQATCGNTSPAPDDDRNSYPDTKAFECPKGSFVGMSTDMATAPFDEEKCCVEYQLSCTKINGNIRRELTSYYARAFYGSDEANEYKCPADQVFKFSNLMANPMQTDEEAPSDETCCEEFTPTCILTSMTGATTNFQGQQGMSVNFFECPEGKTINTTSLMSTSVSESVCCQTFVPTCPFASGELTNPIAFECDPGSISKPEFLTFGLNATQEACCMIIETFTCQTSNAEGQPYVCPSDMAPSYAFSFPLDADQEPSDENCCIPPSCSNMKQETCATNLLEGRKCRPGMVPAPGTEDLVIGGVNSFDDCCEEGEAFSSANCAVASSLAIGLIVIALL